MIRINLLGHETAKPKRRSVPEISVGGSDNAPFLLVIVATVVAIAAAWWFQSTSIAGLEAQLAQVTAEQQELADTAARVRDLEDRRAVVNQKLGVIVDLKKNQSGPVLLLDQISRELADSLWLTDLTLSSGGEVTVNGEALSELSIADFESNLRGSSFFDDTNVQFTQDTDTASVRFQLTTRFIPLTAPPEPPADTSGEQAADPGR